MQADIQRFDAAVSQYVASIYSNRGFFSWATGVEAAFADIERVSLGHTCCGLTGHACVRGHSTGPGRGLGSKGMAALPWPCKPW